MSGTAGGSPSARLAVFLGDLRGGLTAAAVMLAIEGSYGLIAFSTLGPLHQSFAFLCGLYAAAACNVVMALSGARGPLLSGPSAALALLVPPLLATLMADPRFLRAGGVPDAALLLAFVGLGIVLSGVLQVLLGALRLGRVIRYVPYPVLAGVMNGVAVLMVLAMLPHALGVPDATQWRGAHVGAVAVALLAAWTGARPPRWTRWFPSYVTALASGTLLHHAISHWLGDARLGPLLGTLEFGWPAFDALAPLAGPAGLAVVVQHLPTLLSFALATALMASLQSLMGMSMIDAAMRQRRDGERELVVQGLANVGAGCLGTLANSGAVSRTWLNVAAGGSSGVSRAAFGLGLVVLLAVGTPVLRHVPMAAIAGVFFAVSFSLVDDWSRRATAVLAARVAAAKRPPRSLAQSYAVMLLVAGTSVFVSLPYGLAVGLLAAMVMFARAHSRRPIRAVVHADRRSSRTVRAPAAAALLREHGRRIAVVQLDDALFFGTADAVVREIERLGRETTQIVVDFRRVTEVDASGARVLLQAADEARAAGRQVLLAALPRGDRRRRMIHEMDVHETLGDTDFFDDADLALACAEDRLLRALGAREEETLELALPATMLGAGLDAAQLDTLAAVLVRREVSRGAAVFRRGEPGDAMFVSVLGRIAIWLPDAADPERRRRLVSFAPGVVFGEMGLLQHQPRSADAVAEDDAVVLELPRAAYERLSAEQPALVGRLLLNLGLHLSARVRALTDELEAAD
jgi:SulP family sulfate permease